MTELQQTEFEMLKEFVCICNKLNLEYYLVCGSALGAAKYKGFIPWDDDMDVALPRGDYNIFCEKAQDMLPSHLFLQNHKTDKYYPLNFSKIRNSNTTFIEKAYAKTNINHGIYIDVFPLDGYPSDANEQKKLEKAKQRYLYKRLCCFDLEYGIKTKILVGIEKLLGVHKKPYKFVSDVEKQLSLYETETSDIWCNHGNWQGKREYAPRTQYGNGAWAEFEGLRVRIPEKIDEYLTQKYGDWRSDPPESEMVGHHFNHACDTKRSYREYLEVVSEREVRLLEKK